MKHFLALLLGSLAEHHVLAGVVLGVRGHQSARHSQCFQSPAELKAAVDGWAIGGERRSQLLSRYGPMARWDVSQVTNMSGLFQSLKAFNEDIVSWNTSAVNDMSFMFADARSFNKPLRSWNTSAVEDMNHMFYNAATFDQALDLWNTSRVKTMSFMFGNADEFNQSIGSWDTSSVQDMSCMFCYTKAFDQPIGSWNTSAVTDMNSMFKGAASFNQPIGSWDTASVTDMSSMFQHAVAFNQPIGSWNTASVRLMISMFEDAYAFDQFLGFWNIWSVVDRLHMFLNATSFDQPPCRAGRAPAANNLGCTPCPAGQFAVAGARDCESCPAGWISSRNRTVCEQCPEFEYSTGKSDACKRCNFPLILMQNRCVWWHLPLMAFGIVGLAVAGKVVASFSHARTAKKVETIMSELYQDLWIDSESIHKYSAQLEALGLQDADVAERVTAMRALQSERAGVSMRYLLSESFHHLATSRTGKEDPSFMDMKTAFWLSSDPIGHDVRCPRDGRMGCALVDWIPSAERREQTHFMSWTWQYSLMQVRSALDMFQVMTADGPALDGGGVFFFMCFFVNNQFRIIVEESTTGSANLEDVFGNHLKRIGRMVAILDTWEQPVYLQRIWTVYEQFVASTLEIQVTFVMPSAAAGRLEQQIFRGAKGIVEVSQAVGCVNSQLATAWKWEDEVKVKALIQERVGFQHVDQHVKRVMVRWIGDVMKAKFQELVDHTCRVRECGGKASVRQIVQV